MAVSFEWKKSQGTVVEKVQLAGSFPASQWNPVEMKKSSCDEKWALKLDLPPGEYEFKFVVDGNWVIDEDQPTKLSEVGTLNNVIVVKNESSSTTSSMSTSSSIEAISHPHSEDEGWEVITPPQKSPTIEIERKFIVPIDYHDKLLAHGFAREKVYDEVLVDKYYDTCEYALLKKDHWLRQRNGDWELKYPVGLHDKGGSTVYHETTSQGEIQSVMDKIVGQKDFAFRKLIAFADLKTERQCYTKGNVNVVIDSTDWGHRVGEIEIVVPDRDQVIQATKKIEDLGRELDFAPLDLNVLSSLTCN